MTRRISSSDAGANDSVFDWSKKYKKDKKKKVQFLDYEKMEDGTVVQKMVQFLESRVFIFSASQLDLKILLVVFS